MAHVVDTIDGHGPSNEKHRELQPMKTKVMLHILPVYIAEKSFYPLYIANMTEHFSFKSGCVIGVASNEMRGQLQPKKAKVMLY